MTKDASTKEALTKEGSKKVEATQASSPSGNHVPSAKQAASGKPIPMANIPTGKAKWAMIAILYAANVNVSFMQSSMNVALDKVSTDFAISLSQANWVVLGYAIIVGTIITTAASLLKRYGIRKVMMTSILLGLVGSLLGAFAWDFPVLVAARLIQGAATGLSFPVVSDALITLSPRGKAGLLISINSGVIGLGLAVAPSISGLLITYWGLRSLFLLPAAVSLILLAIAFFGLHNLYDRQNKKVDLLSIVLSLIALGTFMYGLNEITHELIPSLILMVIAVVFMVAFVIRQKKLADPLLDLTPLKMKQFSFGEGLIMLGYIGSLYLSLLAPLFLEGVDGRTPFIAGCMLALPITCYAVFCFISGVAVAKRGVWPLVPIGFALTVVGFVAMFFASSAHAIILFLVCVGASYSGVGLLFPATKSADLDILPPGQSSSGSSIHSVLVQIAGSISSALFVGIMSSDVLTMMGHGMTKADAYAAGFSHTALIAIGILAVGFIASFFYAKAVVKISGRHG